MAHVRAAAELDAANRPGLPVRPLARPAPASAVARNSVNDRPPAPSFSQTRIAGVLVGRELRAKLGSIWFYVVATSVCLIAAIVGTGFVNGFATETVLVSVNPLAPVDAFVLVFLGVVLGLRLAAGLSWEREHRTLEILLAGPVRWSTVVVAKFAAELTVFIALLFVYAAYIAIARPLGTAVIDLFALGSLWRMAPLVLPLMGLGLLISAGVASVRLAVTAYLLVLGVLGGIEVAAAWLGAQSPETMALASLHVRAVLDAVRDWVAWVSPLAYAADLPRMATADVVVTSLRPLAAAGVTLAAILLSIIVAIRRGPA